MRPERTRRWAALVAISGLIAAGCALDEINDSRTVPRGSVDNSAATEVASGRAGSRCSAGAPLSVKVTPLSPYVARDGDRVGYFDVELNACQVRRGRRPPADIVLVVDTSSSMSGQKIEFARRAGRYLLSRLRADDRLALVTYDSRVSCHFGLRHTSAANKPWMMERIQGIFTAGMTNLGGGLSSGLSQLTRYREGAISRLILISDGMANVGITSTSALSAIAARARQRGVSTTTMGVGLQFNELLLQSLAEYGGGRYHYIAQAGDLVNIFRDEMRGLQRLAARNIDLSIEACPGCRVVEVPGYALSHRDGRARVTVRDLVGSQSLRALVKVILPRGADRAKHPFRVNVGYRAARAGATVKNLERRVGFRLTADRSLVRKNTHERVASRLLHVRVSKANARAMRLFESGGRAAAVRILAENARRLAVYGRRTRSVRALRRAKRLRSLSQAASRAAPTSRPGRHILKSSRKAAFDAFSH